MEQNREDRSNPARQGQVSQKPRQSRRRMLRALASLAGLCAAGLLILYLLRGIFIEPLLKSYVTNVIRDRLGPTLTIGDISGNYVTGIVIRDVRTTAAGGTGPLSVIEIGRLTAAYSLPALWRGPDAFLKRLALELEGGRIGLDLSRPGAEAPSRGPLVLPSELPEVRVKNTAITLLGRDFSIDVSEFSLEVARGAPSRIGIAAGNVNVEHPSLRSRPFALRAGLDYTADSLVMAELTMDGRTVVEQGRLALDGLPSAFSFALDTNLFGGTLSLAGAKAGESMDLTAAGRNLSLAAGAALATSVGEEIGGELSFDTTLAIGTAAPFGVEGTLALAVENGLFRSRSFSELQGEVNLRDGILEVSVLDGRTAASALSFREGSIPLATMLEGRWRDLLHEAGAEVSLESTDIPAFLALWGVAAPPVREAGLAAHRLRLEGGLSEGRLRITSGDLKTEAGDLRTARLDVAFPLPGESWIETGIGVDADVDVEDLAALSALFPLPPVRGSLRGKLRLDGTVSAPAGLVEAEAAGLVYGERAVGDLSILLEADRQRFLLRRAEIRQGDVNVVRADSLALPAGVLFAGDGMGVLHGLRGDVELRLGNVPRFLGALGVAGSTSPGAVPKHHLTLSGRFEEGGINLSSGALKTADAVVALDRGQLVLPDEGADLSGTTVDVLLSAEIRELAALGKILPLPPLGGAVTGTARLEGPLSGPRGRADMEISGLTYGGTRFGDGVLQGTWADGILSVAALDFRNGEDKITAAGSLHLADWRLDGVEVELQIAEIASYADGLLPKQWLPRGRLQVKLSATGPLGAPLVDFKARFSDGAVGDIPVARADIDLTGEGSTYRIGTFRAETGLGDIGLDDETSIVFREEGTAALGKTVLRLPPGTVTVGGTAGPGGRLDLRLEGRGLTGKGWLEEFVGDRVSFAGADLVAELGGDISRPKISATGRIDEVRAGGGLPPLRGNFDFTYADTLLHVKNFTLDGEAGALAAHGTVPLSFGPGENAPVPLDAFLELKVTDLEGFGFLFPPGLAPRGSLAGELRIGGTAARPDLFASLTSESLFLPEGLAGVPPGPLALHLVTSGNGDRVNLERLEITSAALSVVASGSWNNPPDPARVIADRALLRAGSITLTGTFAMPDISWAAGAFESVRHLGGAVGGEISVEGPLAHPAVKARLQVEGGEASFGGLPLLSSLQGTAIIEDGRITLDGVTGDIGGAPAGLAGHVAFGGGDAPHFDLRLTGEGILLYRSVGVRVRADTDLTVRGPLQALAVGGTVSLVDSSFTQDFDFLSAVEGKTKPPAAGTGLLFSFRKPPLRDMTFDLRVNSREPFAVRNQYVKGTLLPDVRLRGTGELPFLDGTVTIEPSRVVLPAGILRTGKSEILFREDEPGRMGLDIKGSTRIMGYDITMTITEFADDPRILLSSVPPLPNDELLLLVLLGTPPASGDVVTGGVSGSALAFFLGRGYLSRLFGSEDETLDMVLDRFETAVGRDITETGRPTIESTFRLGEGQLFENDSFFLTGERDRFDEINYGVRMLYEFREKDKSVERK